MSGDYSRRRFRPDANYTAVLHQQGRVVLDADWNESEAITDRRQRAQVIDTTSFGCDPAIVGVAVVPRQTPDGFRISRDGKQHLEIGCGRMYVDGLVAENHGNGLGFDPVLAEACGTEGINYYEQPYLPGPGQLAEVHLPKDAGKHLVYLDVWHREVTALENPDLSEPTIGVETTTRIQTVWQVRVLASVGKDVVCATPDSDIPGWPETTRPSAGRLSTSAIGETPNDSPDVVVPGGVNLGLENHLYRVQIHDGGNVGTATFKWSRDNASVGTGVVHFVSVNQLSVRSFGQDLERRFEPGDWIEIIDDWRELSGENGDPSKRHGEIRRIESVDDGHKTLTLDDDLPQEWQNLSPADVAARHFRVLRWDQTGKTGVIPVPLAGTPFVLENGIQVEFSLADTGGTFHSGDYWVFATRATDESIEKLEEAIPHGVYHHFARLAFLDPKLPEPIDCRRFWPPKSCASIDSPLRIVQVETTEGLLRDDIQIEPGTLAEGLSIVCSRDVASQVATRRLVCLVTVYLPFPLSGIWRCLWRYGSIGSTPLVLRADVSVDGNIVRWMPAAGTAKWLTEKLVSKRKTRWENRIRAQLTLRGNPALPEDAASIPSQPSSREQANGSFEMWFWVVRTMRQQL